MKIIDAVTFFNEVEVLKMRLDGKVNNLITAKGREENIKYTELLKDCEVLYGISMSDAMLGLNYSEEIRTNPKLIDNPYYAFHLYKSMYAY